jgi:hypothetical protein
VTRVKAYSTDALSRPLVIVTPERFKSVYEYRFTCAHELGHLLLHLTPLPGDRKQEREADQFAAELLTPRAEIEPLLPKTVRMAALDQLSRTWGVSIESLIYRMGELRLVSDASIRRAHQRLAQMTEFRRDEHSPHTRESCRPFFTKPWRWRKGKDSTGPISPESCAGPQPTSPTCSDNQTTGQTCASCADQRPPDRPTEQDRRRQLSDRLRVLHRAIGAAGRVDHGVGRTGRHDLDHGADERAGVKYWPAPAPPSATPLSRRPS